MSAEAIAYAPPGTGKRVYNAKQVAGLMGIRVTHVYRWKAPFNGFQDADGYWQFDADLVDAHVAKGPGLPPKTKRPPVPLPQRAERGLIASAVFSAFVEGMSPIDAVINLECPPDQVQLLYAEFHRMKGAIVLTGEQLHALYKLPLIGTTPCTTSAELMQLLTDSLAPPDVCSRCRVRPRVLCVTCREQLAQQALPAQPSQKRPTRTKLR